MINYYTTVDKGAIHKVDFESKKFSILDYFRRIDCAYVIDEDGELTVTTKDGEKTYPVHSGDLVLKIYAIDNDYCNREFIVIHNDEIKDYARRYKAFLEESSKEIECKGCDCVKQKCPTC